MVKRKSLAIVVCLSLLPVLSCSKSEDTAPEQRLFGSPPSIDAEPLVEQDVGDVQCQASDLVLGILCRFGLPFQDAIFDNPIVLDGTYNEVRMEVVASDPEEDILLVAASYVLGNEEHSIVLFDDGSSQNFIFNQVGTKFEACTLDPVAGTCSCTLAKYNVNSNDTTADDGTYSRSFAFVTPTTGTDFLHNCIARANAQAPLVATDLLGKTLDFRIDVVDRSGNLTTWPERPEVLIGPSSFACTGDECACCFLTATNPLAQCRTLPGLRGMDLTALGLPGAENGLCLALP